MGIETQIQLFDNAKIRVAWDDEKEKYFFSVVDVLHVLTDSANPQTYWRVLKKRLLDEGNETVTNCNALKLPSADGKMRLTDVADLEGILRIVQSVPRQHGSAAQPTSHFGLPMCVAHSSNPQMETIDTN